MQAENHPEDNEKKLKGLIAGERGRGSAEVMPEFHAYITKLRARIARMGKQRAKQRRRGATEGQRLKQAALRDRDLAEEIARDWHAVDREAWQALSRGERRIKRL
jgi:hypothetical protein